MELPELQELVDSWIKKRGGYWPEFKILGRLIEELGELSQALRKGDEHAIEEETGDLLFTLIAFSNKVGINLENALKRAIKKYDVRDFNRT